MKNQLLIGLQWLPKPPEDFRRQVKALSQTTERLGSKLQFLATHSLNENQLHLLSNKVKSLSGNNSKLDPLSSIKVGILSNASTELIAPAIRASALRHGLALEIVEASFDQVIQNALSPTPQWLEFSPEIVLLALDYRALFEDRWINEKDKAAFSVEKALDFIDRVRAGLHGHFSVQCILQTIARQSEPLFGSLDFLTQGTDRLLSYDFNRKLAERTLECNDLLLDVASLAETVGLANWHDPTLWFKAKIPFSQHLVPLYSDHVCRLLAASRGKSRRCLILDLDNTLWGGVIGDDGLDGIKLGQGSTAGEAYVEVQKTALRLHDRGIVLAVSSKNNDDVARSAFRSHPDMVLKESHVAVFQANWSDKASNIKAIAESLNLGTDSLVFLDDNPAERALVRKALPSVAVPELPDDPSLYPFVLLAGGYFESTAFSKEDEARPAYYKANAERITSLGKAISIDDYLASLDMQLEVSPFDVIGRARITQLINKSNQYNLTTNRYTAEQVQQLSTAEDKFTLQARLTDSFGDNGMISIIIVRMVDDLWEVDTWLMSCRVLGRKVEYALLQIIVECAQAAGARQIIGEYRPSGRNALVSDHYEKLGFQQSKRRDDGTTIWMLDVPSFEFQPLPFTINNSAIK